VSSVTHRVLAGRIRSWIKVHVGLLDVGRTERSEFRLVHSAESPELGHGQRTLNSFDTKDLHQEAIIPATDSSFHGKAVFAGMLLEQR